MSAVGNFIWLKAPAHLGRTVVLATVGQVVPRPATWAQPDPSLLHLHLGDPSDSVPICPGCLLHPVTTSQFLFGQIAPGRRQGGTLLVLSFA